MARRHREWAKKARLDLIKKLGGMCIDCGSTEDLEVDHIDPLTKTYSTRDLDPSWRLSTYRKEAKRGELAVRCSTCNNKKGNREGVLKKRKKRCSPGNRR